MIVISENRLVFSEVERMLESLHGKDPAFDDTLVVLGYNVARYTPATLRKKYPGKRIVAYQLEQLFPGSKWANPHTARWLTDVDEIWEYDLSNLAYLRETGFGNKVKYRPMTYCESLRDIEPREKDIDILFYGYPTPRRLQIVGNIMGGTWDSRSTIWATGVSGEKLRELIARTKVVLNVHAFDRDCRQEQVRLFYLVINGACVVSELSPHNEFGKSIVVAPVPKLGATVNHVLNKGLWEEVGSNAPEVYRKHCEGRK